MNPFSRMDPGAEANQWKVVSRTVEGRDAYGNLTGVEKTIGTVTGVLAPQSGEYDQSYSSGETVAPATLYTPDGAQIHAGDYVSNVATGATYQVVERPQQWVQPRSGHGVGYAIRLRSVP